MEPKIPQPYLSHSLHLSPYMTKRRDATHARCVHPSLEHLPAATGSKAHTCDLQRRKCESPVAQTLCPALCLDRVTTLLRQQG